MYASELKIMELIWASEGIPAKEISRKLKDSAGWSRSTTYTVISKCIEKGYMRREFPDFHCFSLISRKDVQKNKLQEMLSEVFDNSVNNFFAAFSEAHRLTSEEKEELKKFIDDLE